jgi:Cu/Ag efflux protein CusF
MKSFISTALLTMVLGLPITSFAQYSNPGSTTMSGSGQAESAGGIISGTVASVDQNGGTITVNDTLTKSVKTFTVVKKDDLANIKTGDKVNVTVDKDDATKAANVVKQ